MNELEEKLQPLIKEFISDMLADIGPEAKKFGAAIAKDFALYLYQNVVNDDETAAHNLKHLKAQVMNLAVKYQIRAHRITMEKVEKALGLLAQIGLNALKISVA